MAKNPVKMTLPQYAEETAMKLALPAAILAGLVFIVYNWGYTVLPILGRHSVGLPMIVYGFIFTLVVFAYSYNKAQKFSAETSVSKTNGFRFSLSIFTLARVYSLLAAFFTAVAVVLFNYGFKGLEIDIYTSTISAAVYAAVLTYFVVNMAMNVTLQGLAVVLVLFIVTGVGLSMMTTESTDWWVYNFSYLGTFDSTSYHLFNITLMLSALILVAIADYLFTKIREIFAGDKRIDLNRVKRAEQIFIIGGLALGGVGLFSYSRAPTMHNLSAMFAGVFFGALLFGIKWFLPVFPKTFYTISYAIGIGLILAWVVLLNGIGYLSLTAFEFLAAALIGAWIGLFIRNLGLLTPTTSKSG